MITFLLFVIALPTLIVLGLLILRLFIEALPWMLVAAVITGGVISVVLGVGYSIEALPSAAREIFDQVFVALILLPIFAIPVVLIGLPIVSVIRDIIKTSRKPRP